MCESLVAVTAPEDKGQFREWLICSLPASSFRKFTSTSKLSIAAGPVLVGVPQGTDTALTAALILVQL